MVVKFKDIFDICLLGLSTAQFGHIFWWYDLNDLLNDLFVKLEFKSSWPTWVGQQLSCGFGRSLNFT